MATAARTEEFDVSVDRCPAVILTKPGLRGKSRRAGCGPPCVRSASVDSLETPVDAAGPASPAPDAKSKPIRVNAFSVHCHHGSSPNTGSLKRIHGPSLCDREPRSACWQRDRHPMSPQCSSSPRKMPPRSVTLSIRVASCPRLSSCGAGFPASRTMSTRGLACGASPVGVRHPPRRGRRRGCGPRRASSGLS